MPLSEHKSRNMVVRKDSSLEPIIDAVRPAGGGVSSLCRRKVKILSPHCQAQSSTATFWVERRDRVDELTRSGKLRENENLFAEVPRIGPIVLPIGPFFT